jgi:hypothetical protein
MFPLSCPVAEICNPLIYCKYRAYVIRDILNILIENSVPAIRSWGCSFMNFMSLNWMYWLANGDVPHRFCCSSWRLLPSYFFPFFEERSTESSHLTLEWHCCQTETFPSPIQYNCYFYDLQNHAKKDLGVACCEGHTIIILVRNMEPSYE